MREALTLVAVAVVLVVVVLAVVALVVRYLARRVEAAYPPTGRFVEVDDVRLHYVDQGVGSPPVVLLHGNGTRAEDFRGSGLLDRLAARHWVVAFDRPGYGFSNRPRDRKWTPERQAELLVAAFDRLAIERPIVVAHSWATLVALALGLDHPERIRGLVLLAGYYYPTLRPDVLFATAPAIPVVGDVMRYTVSPLVGTLVAPVVLRQMFAPLPVSDVFRAVVPTPLMLRPWQLRASAEEAALMVPAAAGLRHRYAELRVPAWIIAGAGDVVADADRNSAALHRDVPGAALRVIPGLGHMIHYFAQDQIVEAVEALSRRSPEIRQRPA